MVGGRSCIGIETRSRHEGYVLTRLPGVGAKTEASKSAINTVGSIASATAAAAELMQAQKRRWRYTDDLMA